MSTVEEIGKPIERLGVAEQVRLLKELPEHLKIFTDDAAWLKLAESACDFWNNPDDAAYDNL
jgi:hypothetical protein